MGEYEMGEGNEKTSIGRGSTEMGKRSSRR